MSIRFKSSLIIVLCVAATICTPAAVLAHRMLVKPVDNDTVYVAYDDGSAAAGAEVALYDAEGTEVAAGEADVQGLFRFDPAHPPVRIISDDGLGHRAVWEISSGGGTETLPRWLGILLGSSFFLFTGALFYYINMFKHNTEKGGEK